MSAPVNFPYRKTWSAPSWRFSDTLWSALRLTSRYVSVTSTAWGRDTTDSQGIWCRPGCLLSGGHCLFHPRAGTIPFRLFQNLPWFFAPASSPITPQLWRQCSPLLKSLWGAPWSSCCGRPCPTTPRPSWAHRQLWFRASWRHHGNWPHWLQVQLGSQLCVLGAGGGC